MEIEQTLQEIEHQDIQQSLNPRIVSSSPTKVSNGNKKPQRKIGKKKAGDVLGDDDDGTSDDEECLATQTKRRRRSKRKRPKKVNDDEIGNLDFFTDDEDISCDDEDNWSDGSDASACCECKDPEEKSKLISCIMCPRKVHRSCAAFSGQTQDLISWRCQKCKTLPMQTTPAKKPRNQNSNSLQMVNLVELCPECEGPFEIGYTNFMTCITCSMKSHFSCAECVSKPRSPSKESWRCKNCRLHLSTSCEVPLALQEGSTTCSSLNTINVPKGITISKRSVSNTYSPLQLLHKDKFQRPVGISRSLTNSPTARDNFAFPRQQAASSSSPSSLTNLPGITVSSVRGQSNRSSSHFNQLATAGSTPRFRKQPGNETVISLSEKSLPQRSNNNFEFRSVAESKNTNNDRMTSVQPSNTAQVCRAMPKNNYKGCVNLAQPPNMVEVSQVTNSFQTCNDVIELDSDDDDDDIIIVEPSSSDQFQVPSPKVPLTSPEGSSPRMSKKTPKISPRRSDLPSSLYQRERSRHNLTAIFESTSESDSSNSCQQTATATTATSQTGDSTSPNQCSMNNGYDQSTENVSSLSNSSNVSNNPTPKRIVKVLVDETSYQALIKLGFEIVD